MSKITHRSTRLVCETLEARDLPAAWAAAALTREAHVALSVYDTPSNVSERFDLYLPSSNIGLRIVSVRAAAGDVNGDGVTDVALSLQCTKWANPSLGNYTPIPADPAVFIIDGSLLQSNYPFAIPLSDSMPEVVTGVTPYVTAGGLIAANVALADLNGDGRAELITAAEGVGAGPHAKIFTSSNQGWTEAASFFAVDHSQFTNGADVAVGDVTGDGRPDVTFAARRATGGTGAETRVAVYAGLPPGTGYLPPAASRTASVATSNSYWLRPRVAIARVNADARADILLGLASGPSAVTVYSGDALIASGTAQSLGQFTPPSAAKSGVRMVARDADGDGLDDVVFGSAPGQADAVWVGRASKLLSGGAFLPTPFVRSVNPDTTSIGNVSTSADGPTRRPPSRRAAACRNRTPGH